MLVFFLTPAFLALLATLGATLFVGVRPHWARTWCHLATLFATCQLGLGVASVSAPGQKVECSSASRSEFGLIKQKIGQMVVDCYATEAVVSMVAGLVDRGFEEYQVEAAISKVFASEALWRTVDEALQIAASGAARTRQEPGRCSPIRSRASA